MKIKIIITLFLCFVLVTFYGQIIHVPGDQPTIQAGIDAASNGDTVLVDTGTYVENINFYGKNITVASHYLTTIDTTYIVQTIIDGNKEGCVVVFRNFESVESGLIGFTVTNGFNEESWPLGMGGGILTYYANPTLKNLIINNNFSEEGGGGVACFSGEPILKNLTICNNETSSEGVGGGLYSHGSNATLENVVIKYNTAIYGSGAFLRDGNPFLENVIISNNNGIGLWLSNSTPVLKDVSIKYNLGVGLYGGTPVFDSVDRCSIYGNSSYSHKEIYGPKFDLVLDTFSVLYPTDYYVSNHAKRSYDIKYGLLEQIDSDVYVSPNGSNANDGLSETKPLRTMQYAFSKLRADSLHYNKVILLEGEYSHSITGEYFPIDLPDYIDLEGIEASSVILNAENKSGVLRLVDNSTNNISTLTITGGMDGSGLLINRSNSILNNLILVNNTSGESGGGILCFSSNVVMANIISKNNHAFYSGGGIFGYSSTLSISNALISNNTVSYSEGGGGGGGIGTSRSTVYLNNVTIINNSSTSAGGGGIYLGDAASSNNKMWLTNSIVRDNSPNEIAMRGPDFYGEYADKLYCSFSNIQGGEDAIEPYEYDTVFWLEGNIDEEPLFVGSGNHPYQLNDNSPCIDVGTPDTTGLNLPEFDLAGEVRIFNDRVDMGAYEWNIFVGVEEFEVQSLKSEVSCYPNPFTTSTTIKYELAQSETVRITFYNQFGKQVDVIEQYQQQGLNKLVWNPENFANGVYYFRIATGRLQAGEQVASGKVVLMR